MRKYVRNAVRWGVLLPRNTAGQAMLVPFWACRQARANSHLYAHLRVRRAYSGVTNNRQKLASSVSGFCCAVCIVARICALTCANPRAMRLRWGVRLPRNSAGQACWCHFGLVARRAPIRVCMRNGRAVGLQRRDKQQTKTSFVCLYGCLQACANVRSCSNCVGGAWPAV